MEKGLDLVKYQIFKHRVYNILEEGRIAIRQVSGSPVVVEGGETLCSLHMANGDPIMTAAGILLHLTGCMDFIYKTIEWYKDDPGINDGDQFFFSDPYIGGQHTADMVIVKPIFHEGRLVAWVGSCMHTPETGAIEPGGSPATAIEIYQEGIRAQGFKIMDRGKLRPEIFRFILAATRDPSLLALDTKAKIAANNVCANRFSSMINKFGFDFVERACLATIEESESLARDKLKRLPDGTWSACLRGDCSGMKERIFNVVCNMTKRRDEIVFDYSGSSSQNEGSINSTLPATRGSLFAVLCSHLFWDIPWSMGMMRTVKLVAPEGTVVNCKFPAACSQAPPTVGNLIIGAALECMSKMYIAAGEEFYQDINAPWASGAQHPYFGGLNQYGIPFGGAVLDDFASGCGATPLRDGVDSGALLFSPQSNVSDVETLEQNIPFMYLARRNATDSGGYGKFRGGNSYEAIYMVYGTEHLRMGGLGIGKKTSVTPGIFGGYPAARIETRVVRNSDLLRWFADSKWPLTWEETAMLKGEIIDVNSAFPAMPTRTYDIVINRGSGGGGYGDPLDRDPDLVLKDVKSFATSLEAARIVYGVAIDEKTQVIDHRTTEELRRKIKAKRLPKK